MMSLELDIGANKEALVRHARIERMATRIGWAGVLTFAVMLVAAIASIFYKLP